MSPTRFAIDHAVAVYVLVAVLSIAGLAAYVGMPREAAPDITIPVVVVSTPYFGVAPADIEQLVTRPIEEELQDVKNVDTITSSSSEGISIITVKFEADTDIDDAIQKMREKVDKARPKLPEDAEDPTLTEINFSEFPIMLVNFHGDADPLALERVAERIQDRIEKVPGVLSVNLAGGLDREIHVDVDPDKLQHYKLSLSDVVQAMRREHVNLPGGSIDVGSLKYLVRVDGEFKGADALGAIVVKEEDDRSVLLEQVATVTDGWKDRDSASRFNGVPSVSLSIQKRAGENLIAITDGVQQILKEERLRLPTGVEATVTADVSEQIDEMVSDLENNILTGLLLVVLVLFLFMGGVRNSLFVAAAIPLSMLISFIVLDAMGVTLNMVVLFSLMLALGMLVDNAIVIIENIYRHASEGKGRVQAARDAVEEVGWPVITSTATTVAAFFPMMFWPGMMGEFMGFLPLTVIVVLISSLFVALIINPVFASTLLHVKKGQARNADGDAIPDNLTYRAYRATLNWSLRHRGVVMLLAVGSLFGTFVAYGALGHGVEFFPESTPRRAFVKVNAPAGTNLETSDRIASVYEEKVGKLPLDSYVLNIGAGGTDPLSGGGGGSPAEKSTFTLEFKDAATRSEEPQVTIERLRAMAKEQAGAEILVEKESGGPPAGKPVVIQVIGDDYHQLGAIAAELRRKIIDTPGLTDLKDDYVVGRPEIRVDVDRRQAALLGVNTSSIADTVRSAISGTDAIKIRDGADEIDVLVRLAPDARRHIDDLQNLTVTGRDGNQIPLREVAHLETKGGTGSIRHTDQDRVVTIEANAAEGFLPNEVLAVVQTTLADHTLPDGYRIDYAGENKDQAEASAFLIKALLAALFLIALVLVTQFNSLLQPLVIVASVLLSLIGVLWGLILTATPFGIIMVGIGIISLAGVVVNNAIVLIDYTNQLKREGQSSHDAIVRAGLVRFRPVLLTAVTTILGLIPMVIGISFDFFAFEFIFGSTSVEMWGPMARSVAAGLSVATVLTLVVVPVMYSLADDLSAGLARLFGRGEESGDGPSGEQSSKLGTAAATLAVLTVVAIAAAFLMPAQAQAQTAPKTLTLTQVIELAEVHNPDMAQAQERLEQSQILLDRAWAVVIPSASVQGTYTIFDKEQVAEFGPAEIVIRPGTEFRATGTLRSHFDGRIFPLLRSARLSEDVARLSREHLAGEVRYNVTAQYFQLLAIHKLIEISETSVTIRQRVLKTAEDRLAAGVGTEFEVTRAKAEVLNAQRDLERARVSFGLAREALAITAGIEPGFEVVPPRPAELPGVPESIPEEVVRNRPDILAVEKQAQISENQIEAVWWTYAPTLTAQLNASQQEETAFNPDAFSWNVQLIASWTLYDGGLREAELADARSKARSSRLTRDQTERVLRSNYRQAAADLDSHLLLRATAAEQVVVAEKALGQAEDGYRLGALRQLDVLDAEAQLRLARTQLASEELQCELARRNVLRLLGQEAR